MLSQEFSLRNVLLGRPALANKLRMYLFIFCSYDCNKVWAAFEQAYVGRNSCAVPMEAYDPFIASTPFNPVCNKVKLTDAFELLWK